MLYYKTVNPLLLNCLQKLMHAKEFEHFRLVGGTALSLQLGHRVSIDIDLFSDLQYGSIDFNLLEKFLRETFNYIDYFSLDNPSMGISFSIGNNKEDAIKLDVYYTDTYIQPVFVVDGIRMATIEEIIAMKIDIIQRGGRKKDFWDIHLLLNNYTVVKMIELNEMRYPFNHDKEFILSQFTNFSIADNDLDPKCLRGNYWEFIKEDIEDAVKDFRGKLTN